MNFKILILISVLSFNEYAHSAKLPNSESNIKETDDKIATDLLENGTFPTILKHSETVLVDNLAKPGDKAVKSIEPLELAKAEAEVADPLSKEVIITPETIVKPALFILKPAEEKLPLDQKTIEAEPETLKSLLSSEKSAEINEKVTDALLAKEVAKEVVKEATSASGNPTVDTELPAAELKSEPVDLVSPAGDPLIKNATSIADEVKSVPWVEIVKPDESSIKIGLTDTSDIPFLSSGPKADLKSDIKSPANEELSEEECVKDKSPGLTAIFKDPLVTLRVPVSAPVATPFSPSSTQGLLPVNLKNLAQTPTDPTIPPQSKLTAAVLQRPDYIPENPILKREEKILYVVDASKNLYKTVEGDLVRLEIIKKSPEVAQEENKWVKVAPLPYPARTIITDRPKVSHTNFKYTSVPAPRRQLSEASSSTPLRVARNLRYNPFFSQNNFRQRMMLAPATREQNVQSPYYNQDDICSYEDTQPGGRCFLFFCYDFYDRPYLC